MNLAVKKPEVMGPKGVETLCLEGDGAVSTGCTEAVGPEGVKAASLGGEGGVDSGSARPTHFEGERTVDTGGEKTGGEGAMCAGNAVSWNIGEAQKPWALEMSDLYALASYET